MTEIEIWTIGHSTLPIEDFINILKSFDIKLLADVRSYPGSGKYPHFNKEALEKTLSKNHIQYVHMPLLGGRRKTLKDSKNTQWRNLSFRGYADYMETKEFAEGIDELLQKAKEKKTAIMCAEGYWRKCHRLMIADHLKSTGVKVFHITGIDKYQEHSFSEPFKLNLQQQQIR